MEVGTYQMKLNKIEVAVSGQVWDTDDDAKVVPTNQSYNSDELTKTDKQNLKLFTAEQMQVFMVENVRHALTLYGAKVCGFHLEQLGKEEIEEKLETLPIKVIKHPVGNTKYYAAVHVKSLIAQADEEFQELFDRYSNLNDNYEKEVIRSSKLESQIIELKSQLQQQALPVVPESVSEIIEYAKNNKTSIRWFFTEDAYMFPEAMDWYTGSAKGIVDDIYAERQCSLINAFITGKYVVEKPQLFYLREKNTNYYLNKSKNNGLELVPNPYFDEDNQFTQQEIDSMQTGSYEQIEVKE